MKTWSLKQWTLINMDKNKKLYYIYSSLTFLRAWQNFPDKIFLVVM